MSFQKELFSQFIFNLKPNVDIVAVILLIIIVIISALFSKAIDGSGSVSNSQFDLMRKIIRDLIHLLGFEDSSNPERRMAMLQFDSESYIICKFNISRSSLCNSITGRVKFCFVKTGIFKL